MKKNSIIITLAAGMFLMSGCGSKRDPGKIYMPDMGYSRAMETYLLPDSAQLFTGDLSEAGHKIYYNRLPVIGTVHRGDQLFAYTLPNDSNGYKMSAQVKNPLPPLTPADSAEASRLFNINCAICHGADGKSSGPLATSGKIGAIANLTQANYISMADGTMYHSIHYGKNNMGSYAAQLDRKQRWMMVQYIRMLQPKPEGGAVGSAKADSVVANPDSVMAKTSTTSK